MDAAEVAAAVAEADAGAAAAGDGKPKPLSEKKAAERRHVTLMDWGEWPAVLVTVGGRTRPLFLIYPLPTHTVALVVRQHHQIHIVLTVTVSHLVIQTRQLMDS